MITEPRTDPFVCLDDIVGHPVEMNHVIYNPAKDNMAFRAERLFKTIKEGCNVELTSDQINHLIKYDVYQLKDFTFELRAIVEAAKNKK